MSRVNKVNPGKYTQAGRLTPDDTAREMKKQRELAPPRGGAHAEHHRAPRVTRKDKQDAGQPEEE